MLPYYKDKRIFITGHTGFKGVWLCKILTMAGANVAGFALSPPTEPNLFTIINMESKINSMIGDIRNFSLLQDAISAFEPEIVIHLAAQPLVRESYKTPRETYETNVMGTINVLESIRPCISVKSFLNVTTDKVYRNNEWEWGYRENEVLNGYDPYSNSKSCSELITECYKNSFFSGKTPAISTARAGNVIGGGDFSCDRIIPDCIRAVQDGVAIAVRNPFSIRPYQHVLEPLFAYLLIAQKQAEKSTYAGSYNIGPDECDCVSTSELVNLFCHFWDESVSWVNLCETNAPHEANFLKLDCSKAKSVLRWHPIWHIDTAVQKVVDWTQVYFSGRDVNAIMEKQINEYWKGLLEYERNE